MKEVTDRGYFSLPFSILPLVAARIHHANTSGLESPLHTSRSSARTTVSAAMDLDELTRLVGLLVEHNILTHSEERLVYERLSREDPPVVQVFSDFIDRDWDAQVERGRGGASIIPILDIHSLSLLPLTAITHLPLPLPIAGV
jgi:hypothetical protein